MKVKSIQGGSKSQFQRYRDLCYGDTSVGHVMWAEFVILFFGSIPGALGVFLRSKIYPSLFAEVTGKVLIDLIPSNYSPLFYHLPLSLRGKFIRYSIIYGNFDILDSMSDLYISNKMEKANNIKLLGNNRHFYFYQLIPIVDNNQTRVIDYYHPDK